MKRLSISTTFIAPMLPDTAEEWKQAINEVKRKYVSRKYRACSAQCCEILDNINDVSTVEALHLVYLHFYAASSSEMCARPLSQSSAYRTKLLVDAQEHYDKASTFIIEAEVMAVRKTRSASSPSTAPSLRGSSRSSSVCTFASSPRNSISSVEDLKIKAQPTRPKKKKKVSFSGLPDIDIPKNSYQPEPFIRPDSPTLGWEGEDFPFGAGELAPETLVARHVPSPTEVVSPKQIAPVEQEISPLTTLAPVPEEQQPESPFDLGSFIQSRSMNRMILQLSALRSQVAWHRDNIDALMTESEDIPEVPETPTIPDFPAVPGLSHSGSSCSSTSDVDEHPSPLPSMEVLAPNSLESVLSQRFRDPFGNKSSFDLSAGLSPFGGQHDPGYPDAWDRNRSASVSSTGSSILLTPRSTSRLSVRSTGDETLQKRIEKLRANGWQRKRFDNRRYEALREQVLGELCV